MIANNILELIGNTPLLKIATDRTSADIYVKMERNNPTGSVKDRAVLGLYEKVKAEGLITAETIFVEPTSGNTGIALAMIGNYFNHRVILTMPESMSQERRDLLSAYGAELMLTPAAEAMVGAEAKAAELLEQYPTAIKLSQFDNNGNPDKHFETTGKEIIDELGPIDAFVAGIGTGGTISGVGRYLKTNCPEAKVIGFEPEESPMINKGTKGAHRIQGIGAGFIPQNFMAEYVDEVRMLASEVAVAETRAVLKTDGIFVGISSGANIAMAKQVAKELGPNKIVVTVLPDDGMKYLSLGVFE